MESSSPHTVTLDQIPHFCSLTALLSLICSSSIMAITKHHSHAGRNLEDASEDEVIQQGASCPVVHVLSILLLLPIATVAAPSWMLGEHIFWTTCIRVSESDSERSQMYLLSSVGSLWHEHSTNISCSHHLSSCLDNCGVVQTDPLGPIFSTSGVWSYL